MFALAAVAAVQIGVGLILLWGLRVEVERAQDRAQRLVDVALSQPPLPQPRRPSTKATRHQAAYASRVEPKPAGGSPGPQPSHALPVLVTTIAGNPTTAPAGGGSGNGAALGSGPAGGSAGDGEGDGSGDTDLEKVAGEITPSDYPKALGNAGVGGRVSVTFTVEPNGRVSDCRVTRSSGSPQLDALTCRLMEQRFRFRPSTDRYGRPIADEVDWDQDWIAPKRF